MLSKLYSTTYWAAVMLALSCFTQAHADLVARAGKNELRLMERPCSNEAVLALVKDEWKDKFQAARADVNGKLYEACWIDTGQGVYFLAFEDGDMQVYPVTIFINAGA